MKDTTTDLTNIWLPTDEGNHRPTIIEWWCLEGFFRTINDNKQWSLKTTFTEWFEKRPKRIGSFYILSLVNQDTNKSWTATKRNDTHQLTAATDQFKVQYNNNELSGKYPNYHCRLHDETKEMELDLHYHATASPRFVAQNITGGYLPMGLGAYRYGFIPYGTVNGTMKHQHHNHELKGFGYYEHVWGDFSYINPFKRHLGITKSISTYARLITWRLQNTKRQLPKKISIATENNPFGYDWTWGVLDNGWSFFYGNVMFWLMKGPAFGSFILTKDGKNYYEFSEIQFNYDTIKYSQHYDFYYPTKLTIKADSPKESLTLTFQMDQPPIEYINKFSEGRFYRGFVIVEGIGTVKGYFDDGLEKIPLRGICKIEPQRQISAIGHNQLDLTLIKPPKGIGIDISIESHFLKKQLNTGLVFTPFPKCSFSLKKIDESTIHKN